jgi:hypothetical protein
MAKQASTRPILFGSVFDNTALGILFDRTLHLGLAHVKDGAARTGGFHARTAAGAERR